MMPNPASGRIPILVTVDQLTAESDVVAVGEAVQVLEGVSEYRQIDGRTVKITPKTAQISVSLLLKGNAPSGLISVHAIETFDPAGGLPPSMPPQNKTRIMFLKQSSPDFEFVSAVHSTLPAIRGSTADGSTPQQKVISQLLLVLEDQRTSTSDKLEALSSLYAVQDPRLAVSLGRAFDNRDPVLHLQLISERLRRNQVTALPEAIRLLSRQDSSVPAYLLPNLDYAIRDGISAKEALPWLISLLRSGNVEDRRAAASALKNIDSSETLGPLKKAVFDTDLDVQYYAVMGLANISGDKEWLPNAEVFRSEHPKYIGYWRGWAQNH
jgi:hypothetical protein